MPDPPQSLGVARYYGPTLPNVTAGQPAVSPCDRHARPIVAAVIQPGAAGTQWEPSFSTALDDNFSIASLGMTIRSIACRIDSAAPTGSIYVQLWNMPDPPADGTSVSPGSSLMAPVKIQHVAGIDDNFSLDFDEGGILAPLGITLCLSTTEFVLTLGPGPFLSASASFAGPPL